jgi:hypothetical protein
MNGQVDILIPNRFTWNAVCLTVESILKRTDYPDYVITVCDNSRAANNRACEPHPLPKMKDTGERLEYLQIMARLGYIRLIENDSQDRKYGHGENLKLLVGNSKSDYAFLFNSSSEILRPDWITVLVNMIKDPEKDIGVARFRGGGNHFDKCWITPNYWPNMMLLNMRLYREFYPDNTWELAQVPFETFSRKEVFAGQPAPKEPEHDPPLVFCDTGWTLYERLQFDNPKGLRMLALPDNYWNTYIHWYGGIDRNSHRPDHPYVVETLAKVNERLALLRKEV